MGARLGRGQAKARGFVPNTARDPPQGSHGGGGVGQQDRHQPGFGQGLDGPAGRAAMVRAANAGRRDTLLPDDRRKLLQHRVEGRIGEAMGCVDGQHPGPGPRHRDCGVAHHLAGLDLGRVGGHPREPVALQTRRPRRRRGRGRRFCAAGAPAFRSGYRASATSSVGGGEAQGGHGCQTLGEVAAHGLGGHARDTHVRFLRHARDVRRQDEVGQIPEKAAPAAASRGSCSKHVKGGTAEMPGPQRLRHGRAIHHLAPRGIDQHRPGRHSGDGARIDHPASLGCQRHMQGQDVRAGDERLEIDSRHRTAIRPPGRVVGRQEGVVGRDPHPEGESAAGGLASNGAEPDEAEALARDLPAHQRVARPGPDCHRNWWRRRRRAGASSQCRSRTRPPRRRWRRWRGRPRCRGFGRRRGRCCRGRRRDARPP